MSSTAQNSCSQQRIACVETLDGLMLEKQILSLGSGSSLCSSTKSKSSLLYKCSSQLWQFATVDLPKATKLKVWLQTSFTQYCLLINSRLNGSEGYGGRKYLPAPLPHPSGQYPHLTPVHERDDSYLSSQNLQ